MDRPGAIVQAFLFRNQLSGKNSLCIDGGDDLGGGGNPTLDQNPQLVGRRIQRSNSPSGRGSSIIDEDYIHSVVERSGIVGDDLEIVVGPKRPNHGLRLDVGEQDKGTTPKDLIQVGFLKTSPSLSGKREPSGINHANHRSQRGSTEINIDVEPGAAPFHRRLVRCGC